MLRTTTIYNRCPIAKERETGSSHLDASAGLSGCSGAAVVGLDGCLIGIHLGTSTDKPAADEPAAAATQPSRGYMAPWLLHLTLQQAAAPDVAAGSSSANASGDARSIDERLEDMTLEAVRARSDCLLSRINKTDVAVEAQVRVVKEVKQNSDNSGQLSYFAPLWRIQELVRAALVEQPPPPRDLRRSLRLSRDNNKVCAVLSIHLCENVRDLQSLVSDQISSL